MLGVQPGLDGFDVFSEQGDGFFKEFGGLGQGWIVWFGGGEFDGFIGCGFHFCLERFSVGQQLAKRIEFLAFSAKRIELAL